MNDLADLSILASFVVLMGYVLVHGLLLVQQGVLRNRNVSLERELLRSKIDRLLEARQFEKKIRECSWNGFRKFEVTRKVIEGEGICSFYLSPHDRKNLPPFRPGQYLTFQLQLPDRAVYPGGRRDTIKAVIRCYSLSDSPFHSEAYRVSIKRTPPPRDKPEAPPGLVSNYFHDHIQEGSILDVKAPAGKFTLEMNRQTPVVLVGGGVGVTPVLSMLNAIAESGLQRETWFFYGIRNGREQIMKDHLQRIDKENENIRVLICYSDPSDQDVQGKDYHHAERVCVDLFKRLLPSNNYEYYICGPPPLMNQMTKELKEWGVPDNKIFFEAFGPATVKKMTPLKEPAAAKEPVKGFQVTFAKAGKKYEWKPGQGSLLELAEANDVRIDSGCRAGSCGTCLTAIQSGEVSYAVDHGAKPEAGSCLACIAEPKTDLVLDA